MTQGIQRFAIPCHLKFLYDLEQKDELRGQIEPFVHCIGGVMGRLLLMLLLFSYSVETHFKVLHSTYFCHFYSMYTWSRDECSYQSILSSIET